MTATRRDAFKRRTNSCIRWNTQGHGVRQCTRPCINAFPHEPWAEGEKLAWRRWQRRMGDSRTPDPHSRRLNYRKSPR